MLSELHERYFASIKLTPKTVLEAGVYSDGNEVCYPTLVQGQPVNLKFRGQGKKFRQAPDGRQAFYNYRAIDQAIEQNKPLLITEGENDCLSALEAGYQFAVSIPCGAPQKESEVYEIENDNKFKFVWDDLPKLKKITKFILAGDNDEAGKILNIELSKRLGPENCKFIQYPDGCKDLNDVLKNYDGSKVNEVINSAKDFPVVGLFKPTEFPAIPDAYKKQYTTGYGPEHDHHIKLQLGKFMVVTGVPSHGKSEWADGLVLNLAKQYGWRIAVCSTEINHDEYEENTLTRYVNGPIDQAPDMAIANAKKFYNNHFRFITNSTMDDFDLTLERLIEIAEIAILRDGCKVLLLDPWNELEHCRGKHENETEYTGRAIRMLKKLARQYCILVIVVVHPAKPEGGRVTTPTLYSISGSANWSNKADYGLVLWREDTTGKESELIVSKIKRHGPMGHTGYIKLNYESKSKKLVEAI